jgi:hypothetical protein
VLQRTLRVTQRQLSSTLGGVLSVSVASMLLWLQARSVLAALAALRGALFVTVEVNNTPLRLALQQHAALGASTEPARARCMAVLTTTPRPPFLARAKRAAAACGNAPVTVGNRVLFSVLDSAELGVRSDPNCYSIFEPAREAGTAPEGDPEKAPPSRLSVRLLLGGKPAWVHTPGLGPLQGNGGLLSGAPEPLLRLLDSSGLRELFAPVDVKRRGRGSRSRGLFGESDSEGEGEDDNDAKRPVVCVSVLRWHGSAHLHALLRAAFQSASVQRRGMLQVVSVRCDAAGADRRSRFDKLLGLPSRDTALSWEPHEPVLARSMRTVVLPPAAADVRTSARRFMSPEYRAFCRDRGIPHRCGYALYGPAGCGKTSFVSALAAELGAKLHTLMLDPGIMTDMSLKELLRRIESRRTVLLVEDADAALPEAFLGDDGTPSSTHSAPTGSADGKAEGAGGAEAELDEEEEEEEEEKEDASGGDDDPFGALGAAPSDDAPGARSKATQRRKRRPHLTLAGLIEALSGPGAPEACILFLTTNHMERLPRALVRPGIIDAAVEFTYGTQAMIEELFTNFYLLADDENDENDEAGKAESEQLGVRLAAATAEGVSASTVRALARAFAERCGERRLGMAAVQGHLLDYRDDPHGALEHVGSLVDGRRAVMSTTSTVSTSSAGSSMPDAHAAALAPLAPAPSYGPLRASDRAPGGDAASTAEVLLRQRRLGRALSSGAMSSAASAGARSPTSGAREKLERRARDAAGSPLPPLAAAFSAPPRAVAAAAGVPLAAAFSAPAHVAAAGARSTKVAASAATGEAPADGTLLAPSFSA